VKLESKKLKTDFIKKVEELSGQNLYACYQCGKCSAGCPIVDSMDILPNQIARLIQFGEEREVLDSKTIWLCAACLQCMNRCPKGVDIARIMDAVRNIILRKGLEKFKITGLGDDFMNKIPQQALVSAFRKYT